MTNNKQFDTTVMQDLRQFCIHNQCFEADNYGCKDCWKMKSIVNILMER